MPGEWAKLSEFRQLLAIRALRPDRITNALQRFCERAMGPQYVNQVRRPSGRQPRAAPDRPASPGATCRCIPVPPPLATTRHHHHLLTPCRRRSARRPSWTSRRPPPPSSSSSSPATRPPRRSRCTPPRRARPWPTASSRSSPWARARRGRRRRCWRGGRTRLGQCSRVPRRSLARCRGDVCGPSPGSPALQPRLHPSHTRGLCPHSAPPRPLRYMKEGGWVFLDNVHLMQGWIPRLERKLELAAENAHPDFRCGWGWGWGWAGPAGGSPGPAWRLLSWLLAAPALPPYSPPFTPPPPAAQVLLLRGAHQRRAARQDHPRVGAAELHQGVQRAAVRHALQHAPRLRRLHA
jgi:hypothetical protein